MQDVFKQLEDIAKVEREPHMEGKRLVMLVSKR
jgi:translation initiation factor IF-3